MQDVDKFIGFWIKNQPYIWYEVPGKFPEIEDKIRNCYRFYFFREDLRDDAKIYDIKIGKVPLQFGYIRFLENSMCKNFFAVMILPEKTQEVYKVFTTNLRINGLEVKLSEKHKKTLYPILYGYINFGLSSSVTTPYALKRNNITEGNTLITIKYPKIRKYPDEKVKLPEDRLYYQKMLSIWFTSRLEKAKGKGICVVIPPPIGQRAILGQFILAIDKTKLFSGKYFSIPKNRMNIMSCFAQHRFLIFELVVINSDEKAGNHSVLFFADTQEREISIIDSNGFDIYTHTFKDYFLDFLTNSMYMPRNIYNWTYQLPTEGMTCSFYPSSGPQLLEDAFTYTKGKGDYPGYCQTWVYWMLELKILNPDVDWGTLLSYTNAMIGSKYTNLTKMIRHYGYGIYKEGEKLTKQLKPTALIPYKPKYDPNRWVYYHTIKGKGYLLPKDEETLTEEEYFDMAYYLSSSKTGKKLDRGKSLGSRIGFLCDNLKPKLISTFNQENFSILDMFEQIDFEGITIKMKNETEIENFSAFDFPKLETNRRYINVFYDLIISKFRFKFGMEIVVDIEDLKKILVGVVIE